ncbi:MAG: hypothetical protein ACPG4T_21355 [Nannocystaceae bacterium]
MFQLTYGLQRLKTFSEHPEAEICDTDILAAILAAIGQAHFCHVLPRPSQGNTKERQTNKVLPG